MTIQLAAVGTSGGLLVTASALGTTLAGFFFLLTGIMAAGKRRKRDSLNAPQQIEEEQMVRMMMYKVLNELDQYDCTALALCDAIVLPAGERSPVQSSLINMLRKGFSSRPAVVLVRVISIRP
ncbi:uncharacterized protein [Macrobrachium rosenbergii]|uniref:uncharacterized protein isoform X2 n=1 Tax=Macrobrachium rosenbergii TaxID=79674 RepID=UPI0034D77178